MPKALKKALSLLVGTDSTVDFLKIPKNRPLKTMTERELIQLESEIGKELFGPIPAGHRREFFNLDPRTWIWYEEYLDAAGKKQTVTTRYEVQDKGVLKAQEGARYSYIDGEELQNFDLAIRMYYEQVMRDVYKKEPRKFN